MWQTLEHIYSQVFQRFRGNNEKEVHGTPIPATETEGLRIAEILDAALKSRDSGKKELVTKNHS